MTSVDSLIMAYKKIDNQRIIGGTPSINIFYLSDNDSSGDDCKPKIVSDKKHLNIKKYNNKLEYDVTKYIKKKHHGR